MRRAEEQLKTSVAKLRAGSATRSDSLRSLVTLGNARLDLITTQTQLAAAEANLARLIGETGRVQAADDSAFYRVRRRSTARPSGRGRVQVAPGAERGGQRRGRAGLAQCLALRLLAVRSPWRPTPAGMAAGPTTTICSNQRQISLALRWNLFNGFDRELTIVQREASSTWPRPPPPTPSARCRRS